MFPAVLWAMDSMWQQENVLLMMAGIKKFRMAFKKIKITLILFVSPCESKVNALCSQDFKQFNVKTNHQM